MHEELAQKQVIKILEENQIDASAFKIPQIKNTRKNKN
jgi:hypothetical protein